MWLVNFANDNYVEFYAIDIEELMLLIVEYTNNDRILPFLTISIIVMVQM